MSKDQFTNYVEQYAAEIKRFDGLPVYTRRQQLAVAMQQRIAGAHILEFGVYRGGSIKLLADLAKPCLVHGFDSFEGLPEDWHVAHDLCRPKGHFALAPGEPLYQIPPNVVFHQGWFKYTAPQWVADNEGRIGVVHLDCDLYSSTMDALLAIDPLIAKGTLLIFDEYAPWPEGRKLYTRWLEGEYKALRDWCTQCYRFVKPMFRNNEYGATFKVI